MSNQTNTALGLLAGTAIGAIVGILYAPDKGSETRKRISEKAMEAKDHLVDNAHTIKDSVLNSISAHKDSLDGHLEALVTSTSYKADEVIDKLEEKLKELKAKNKRIQKSA